MSDSTFSITVEQESDYVFRISFDETAIPALMTDEPEPLGGGSGPNPSRMLVAAVANCMSASLLFALRKQKDTPTGVRAEVKGELERQEGRWRIGHLHVTMQVDDAQTLEHLPQALEQFEDFCTVTQSIRQGIPVSVEVRDQQGKLLKTS